MSAARLRPAAALLAAALAAMALLALAAAPRAQAAKPRVTLIGDSVAASFAFVPSATRQLGAGLDLRVDAKVCRRLVSPSCSYRGSTPSTALQLIRSRGSGLGRVVVMDVGYNEGSATYRRDLDTVMAALRRAGVRRVLWVTLREARSVYASSNAAIRAGARRHPQMTVVDWNAASRGKAWFRSDGLHLTPAGATELARLLRPEVLKAVAAAKRRR